MAVTTWHRLRAARLLCGAALLLAASAGAALAQTPGGPDIAELPRDLSPWGMFLSADPLVKAVLIGLAFASVVTWTVWLAKTVELVMARGRVNADLRTLATAPRLGEAFERLAASRSPATAFLEAAV